MSLRDLLSQDQQTHPPMSIAVPISYDIIQLFSEGLYQSPHKAVEELVANSFDAGAKQVSVVIPERDAAGLDEAALWVIDDGCGMDEEGFRQLWRVAESPKYDLYEQYDRPQIGQFGIGKLAAFVLAWRLTHISKSSDGVFRYTSMNFHDVTGRRLSNASKEPVTLDLKEISEDKAKLALSEIKKRDPDMWGRLFGPGATSTWTAAALEEFKDLAGKLYEGTLGWVLRTGLPLVSDFDIRLNGKRLESSKASGNVLYTLSVGGEQDESASALNMTRLDGGVEIPGINGIIKGQAQIFERVLSTGKSNQYGRSHGFFVRVRGRVINLADELFGLEVQNHSAWARFSMEIDADGLRDHLLSSREGVRDSDAIENLRKYMHHCFNACRKAYDNYERDGLAHIEIENILNTAPLSLAADPLMDALGKSVSGGGDLFYIQLPEKVGPDWLAEVQDRVRQQIFTNLEMQTGDPWDRMCTYHPETGLLVLNAQHPYIAIIRESSKNAKTARLVALSEVVTEVLLRTGTLPGYEVDDVLRRRDRMFRRLAGAEGIDAPTVMRRLKVAETNWAAMERAVGQAFELLGFEYEDRVGSNGPDGILRARRGRGENVSLNFTVIYDTKTSNSVIDADKVDLQAIGSWVQSTGSQYGLVVGRHFAGADDPDSSLNTRVADAAEAGNLVTVLRTDELIDLLKLHYRFGVTLGELQDMFREAHTIHQTVEWVARLKQKREQEASLPLHILLDALERSKEDIKARPSVGAARIRAEDELLRYEPERLIAALQAVSTLVGDRLLRIDDSSGNVQMESPATIIAEFQRRLADELDIHERSMLVADA